MYKQYKSYNYPYHLVSPKSKKFIQVKLFNLRAFVNGLNNFEFMPKIVYTQVPAYLTKKR